MPLNLHLLRSLTLFALLGLMAGPARADDLRNVKRGEPVPAYRLPSLDGTVVDSDALKGSVVVIVCLSAEQRRSELAAMDSDAVVHAFESDQVKLVHLTADLIQKAYFEKFRADRGIAATLAFDADRALYAKLGLIVFPTTIIVNRDGKLAQVISLHDAKYKHVLDAYLRHTLGKINDDQLKELLVEHASDSGSPKSTASAHRALARTLREKGQLDQAKDELVKAGEQDPENAEVMLDLADLELFQGDLDGAEAQIQKVLQSKPDHRRAKQLKGVLLFRRGQYNEAEVVLVEALNLNPSPEVAHYYLGRIYEQKGQTDKALEHYREALRRFVHEPTAPAAAGPGK